MIYYFKKKGRGTIVIIVLLESCKKNGIVRIQFVFQKYVNNRFFLTTFLFLLSCFNYFSLLSINIKIEVFTFLNQLLIHKNKKKNEGNIFISSSEFKNEGNTYNSKINVLYPDTLTWVAV